MTRRPHLATELTQLPETRGRFAWSDHEYVRGWGIFGLPFDSGHVLALRVFPQNDFAPYRTVWHRTPDGAWSIFVDGPRLDTACPRYYGPACATVAHARIDVQWLGADALRISMADAALSWSAVASTTPLLRVLNAVSPRLPLWTWKRPSLVRTRERIARRMLGVGAIRLSGVMPSGHVGTLMPQRMYFIEDAAATLDGMDLGRPDRAAATPDIGGVTLPARGVLAVGQAAWQILDSVEYERTRSQTADAARAAGG